MAEAFNFGDKTDILIRHEGRSLFIAECKFWAGAKGFSDTLDLQFGYQAWRDTKLAVLMFVRERDLTAIVESTPGWLTPPNLAPALEADRNEPICRTFYGHGWARTSDLSRVKRALSH
jgi:hypothetical protein